MVQIPSIIFFLGFLQFLLGFSKVPVFFVSPCIRLVMHSHTINITFYKHFQQQCVSLKGDLPAAAGGGSGVHQPTMSEYGLIVRHLQNY